MLGKRAEARYLEIVKLLEGHVKDTDEIVPFIKQLLDERYERLEKEHLGDPELETGIYAPKSDDIRFGKVRVAKIDGSDSASRHSINGAIQDNAPKRKVIASWCISNVASLNVYEIENGINDRMLVGINDDEPEWCEIDYDFDDDNERLLYFIKFNDSKWYLDECMKVAR